MKRPCWILAAASLVISSTSLAAQVASLPPHPSDSRLWVLPRVEAAPISPEIASLSSRHRPVRGNGFLAGYAIGAAVGMRFGEKAKPPREIGLWLRGWYEGAVVTEQLGPATSGIEADRPAIARMSNRGAERSFGNGVVRGFLGALAITANN